jgi:mono/diheme cytochrome c family protein
VVKASRRIPAISGGTLATGMLGPTEVAVASDPETDRIWIAPVAGKGTPISIDLEVGAEPGRVAISGGVARVLLRGSGELATIDLATSKLVSRVAVCQAPRGLDVEEKSQTVAVSCLGGELLLLDAVSGATTAKYQLDRDLRDVVLRGEEIVVSRFRSSELIVLYRNGALRDQRKPATESSKLGEFAPSVAWRMVPTPDGGVMVLHQQSSNSTVQISHPGGYGSQQLCDGLLHSSISLARHGTLKTLVSQQAALVVDVAVSPDGRVAFAVASRPAPSQNSVSGPVFDGAGGFSGTSCGVPPDATVPLNFEGISVGVAPPYLDVSVPAAGDVVAVSFTPTGHLVAQHRAPARLEVDGSFLSLGDPAEIDTGHTIFHSDSGAGIACASCHPEGGDDGRVWTFEELGARRTQPLQGGLKGSEPFHWSGDMPDFNKLVSEVFVHRMGGPATSDAYNEALLDWMDTIPALPSVSTLDAGAVARGQTLFEDPSVGCASCHNGARLSNNTTVDVGTGGPFQVPTLRGLAYRAPFLHDGRAGTLRERFNSKGGGDQHGVTSTFSASQIGDLITYLESL